MSIGILGCGYIGHALLNHLKTLGHTVYVTTTTPAKKDKLSSADRIFVLKGNDKEKVRSFLTACNKVVITVAGGDYAETYLQTAHTVRDVLPETVQQVIYTSSTSVYADGDVVTEESPRQEGILTDTEDVYLTLPHICIFRLAGIIGPGRTLQDRARKFAGQTLPGNPDSPVNLIDQETIVHAITWALNTNQTGIFNLAHPEHPTRSALYNQLAQELGVSPIHWDPTLPSKHGGNKKISSAKIHAAGFQLMNLGW